MPSYTHFTGVSSKENGFAVGGKGKEKKVLSEGELILYEKSEEDVENPKEDSIVVYFDGNEVKAKNEQGEVIYPVSVKDKITLSKVSEENVETPETDSVVIYFTGTQVKAKNDAGETAVLNDTFA